MVDKVIVSNRSALQFKYKPAGFGGIHAALKSLVQADAKRGLKTKIIFLDAVSDMAAVSGKAVGDTGDCRQNKDAVDAVFKKLAPQDVMLLGSIDVISHQDEGGH